MLEWAEQEVIIPSGRYEGLRFSVDRQPAHRLLLAEYENPRWRRIALTGPTQSGKSLVGFVIPIGYHLFERGETVACGVPLADMAHDKWDQDIKPMIERTRYAEFLPQKGPGSRGGRQTAIRFRNGSILRFLSAAGGVKAVAGFTCRVLAATEVDGYDDIKKGNDESDKVTLMEGRLMSYGADALSILECTVSSDEGRIWKEIADGTCSRILIPCPQCGEFIALERENLQGWRDAATEGEAARNARWVCLLCGSVISEEEREKAHRRAVLAHKGQEVDKRGKVRGDIPDTFTLGFRYSAGNNLFMDAGTLGLEEWKAVHSQDPENAERKMCQMYWAVPPPRPKADILPLEVNTVMAAAAGWPRSVVPAWARWVTAGMDVGLHICHWTATAWAENGTGMVIDYGIIETNARQLGEERGISTAVAEFEAIVKGGWLAEGGRNEERMKTAAAAVDSGSRFASTVYRAAKRSGLWVTKGYGSTQRQDRFYKGPKSTGTYVLKIGVGYHWARLQAPRGQVICEFNADVFKAWIHARLQTPDGQAGTLRMYGREDEHFQFAKHLTAEQEVEEKGVKVWRQVGSNNHWLDSTVISAVCARELGVSPTPGVAESAPASPGVRAPGVATRARAADPEEAPEAVASKPVSRPVSKPASRPAARRQGKIRSRY